MLSEFQAHIEKHFPELQSRASLLALSGGLDSMVLMQLMHVSGFEFSVAHCNFQLRGEAADQDEAFVMQAAREYGKKIFTKKFDTTAFASEKGISVQMAARELRYDWFRTLMDQEKIPYLVTAHHADDNLETFLINLSRGSGLNGLTGIPEKSNNILRPLLNFSRDQIRAYASENNILWREDESNKDPKYLRNAIRAQLLPVLKQVSPNFMESFGQAISHLKESRQLVSDQLETIEAKVLETDPENPSVVKYRLDAILKLSDPKAYLYHLLHPYGFKQWEDILGLLHSQSGKMVLSDSHRLVRDRDHLLLQALEPKPGKEIELKIPSGCSEVVLPHNSKRIRIENVDAGKGNLTAASKTVAYFDEDLLGFPLLVRKWRNGDYFYPKGMKGRKKLSKFFKDEKLSLPEKENIWLLCAGKEIVWVIGHRTDRRFALSEKSQKVLKFEIENLL